MEKKKWIKEIVGSALEKHGFEYKMHEYEKDGSWRFVREVDSIE